MINRIRFFNKKKILSSFIAFALFVSLFSTYSFQSYASGSYTITLLLNGGKLAGYDASEGSVSIPYNEDTETFTLDKPEKEGFVFDGWYEENNEDNAVMDVTIAKGSSGNHIYKAKWINEYTITYHYEQATVEPDNPKVYSSKTTDFELINPEKTGYTFKGWSVSSTDGILDSSLNGIQKTVVIKGSTMADTCKNLVITANWIPDDYAVIETGDSVSVGSQWKVDYQGKAQLFIAPADGLYCYELWGAGSVPAYRGYTRTYEYLHAGDERYVYVGGTEPDNNYWYGKKTYNGGGIDKQGNHHGGGATDIRVQDEVADWFNAESKSDDHLLAVAGGGSAGILNAESDTAYNNPRFFEEYYKVFVDTDEENPTQDLFKNAGIYKNLYGSSFLGSDGGFWYEVEDAKNVTPEDDTYYLGGFGGGYNGASYDSCDSETDSLLYAVTGKNWINDTLLSSHEMDYVSMDYSGRDVPFTSIYNKEFLDVAYELEQGTIEGLEYLHTSTDDVSVYGGDIDFVSFGTINYDFAVEQGIVQDDTNGFAFITYLSSTEEELTRSVPTSLSFDTGDGHFATEDSSSESGFLTRVTFDYGFQFISLDTLIAFVQEHYGTPVIEDGSFIFGGWSDDASYGADDSSTVAVSSMVSQEGNTALGYENCNPLTIYALWDKKEVSVELSKYLLSAHGENTTDYSPTNDKTSSLTVRAKATYPNGQFAEGLYYSLFYQEFSDTNGDGNSEGLPIQISSFSPISEEGQEYMEYQISISNNGNGNYFVAVSDKENASSEEDFLAVSELEPVSVFDTDAPVILENGILISEKDVFTKEKSVSVSADEGELGKTNVVMNVLYYYLEKADSPRTDFSDLSDTDWSTENTFQIKENGTYFVYVKDKVGNICQTESEDGSDDAFYGVPFTINTIDDESPVITMDDEKRIFHESGQVVFYGIKVVDESGVDDLTYQAYDNIHKKELDMQITEEDSSTAFLRNTNFLKTSTGYPISSYDTDLTPTLNNFNKQTSTWFFFVLKEDVDFTLTATDKRGNVSNTLHVVKKLSDYNNKTDDGFKLIDGTGYITINPDITTWTPSLVTLTPSVSGFSYNPDEDCFLWQVGTTLITSASEGDWVNGFNNKYQVDKNDTYTVYVKSTDGNIYYKSFAVTNIDKTAPIVKSKTLSSDGKNLKLSLYDGDSGLKSITVLGGTQELIKELSLSGNTQDVSVTIAGSGTYTVYIYDNCDNVEPHNYNITVVDQEEDDGIHVVCFVSYSGGIVKAETVEHHGSATPPASLTRSGYTFAGWDNSYVDITKDTVCTAVWVKNKSEEDKTYHVVTFTNDNGAVIKSQKVEHGGSATPPTVTKAGYTLSGWDKPYVNVKEDITCKAIFKENTTKTGNGDSTKSASTQANASKVSNTGNTTTKSNETTSKASSVSTPTTTNTSKITSSTVSGNSLGEDDDLIEELQDETEEGENADNTDSYLSLMEYADEAIMLSESGTDNNLTVNSQASTDNKSDSEFISEMLEDTGEVESTQASEYENAGGFTAGQVVAVIVIISIVGAVVFYFLNKKYFWINLPF